MHYTSHGSIRPHGASWFGWLEVLNSTISLQSSKWFHYQNVERLPDFQKHQCINPTSKHRDESGTRYEQRVGDSSVMIWSDVSLVNVSCRILPHKLKNNFATIVCRASIDSIFAKRILFLGRIQDWFKHQMGKATKSKTLSILITLIESSFPLPQFVFIRFCYGLLSHTQKLVFKKRALRWKFKGTVSEYCV